MRRLFLISFLLLIFTAKMWAGWKIIVHQNRDGIQEIITYSINKNGMKISNSEFDFIYYKSQHEIIVINHKTKSVFQGSFIEYSNQLSELMHINANRADEVLPKSFVLRFDELLSQIISDNQDDNIRTTPSLRVENANYDKQIAQYDAIEYDIFFDAALIERIWLSQDIIIGNDFDLIEVFNFFRGIKSISLSQSKNLDTQEYEQLLLRGFPLKIINSDNLGFEVFKSEVVSIQETDVYDQNTFSPPKNYQNRTLIDLIIAKD